MAKSKNNKTGKKLTWPLPLQDPASPKRWDADVPLPAPRANNPVRFWHHIEYGLMGVLTGFFRLLGIDRASAFSGTVFRTIGPLIKPVNKKALRNLRYVMPENSDQENRKIIRDIWENFGRTLAEFSMLDQFKPFEDDRFELEGAEILEKLVRDETQAIYFSGHFANWELMSPLLYRAGVRNGFIYRPMNNPLTDKLVIARRASTMSRVQLPKGKQGGRSLIRILVKGYSILTMQDQKLNTGEPIPFMGKEAMTAVAATRMALKYKLPLVPVAIRRLDGARFRVIIREPIIPQDTGDINKDVYDATLKMNDVLGEIIREKPGDWLWFHGRWPKDQMGDL